MSPIYRTTRQRCYPNRIKLVCSSFLSRIFLVFVQDNGTPHCPNAEAELLFNRTNFCHACSLTVLGKTIDQKGKISSPSVLLRRKRRRRRRRRRLSRTHALILFRQYCSPCSNASLKKESEREKNASRFSHRIAQLLISYPAVVCNGKDNGLSSAMPGTLSKTLADNRSDRCSIRFRLNLDGQVSKRERATLSIGNSTSAGRDALSLRNEERTGFVFEPNKINTSSIRQTDIAAFFISL